MEVFSLIGRLTLDGAQEVRSKLQETEGAAEQIGQGFRDVGGKMTELGGNMTKWVTGPAAAIGGSLLALATKTADYGEEVLMAAERTGMAVEDYQAMSYALEQLGVDQSHAERAMGRLNTRIGEARQGNENYQEALEAVGVSMQDVQDGTIDTEEAMRTAISSLRDMEDSQDRAAAAAELFGQRASRELLPALRDSEASIEDLMEEAHELGMVMDEDAARASEEFNDAMHRMRETVMGAVRELGAELIPLFVDELFPVIEESVIPAIRGLIEALVNAVTWFADLPGPVRTLIGVLGGLVAAAGPVLVVVGQITTAIGALIPAISGIAPAIAPLLGPAGIIMALVGLFWVFREEIGEVLYWIGERIVEFVAAVDESFQQMYDYLAESLQRYREWHESLRERIITAIREALQWGVDLVMSFAAGIQGRIEAVVETLQEIYENIRDFFLELPGEAVEWGRDMVRGFVDGIRDLARRPVDAVSDMASSVRDSFAGALGLDSPSKVFEEFGRGVIEGFEQGVAGIDEVLSMLTGGIEAALPGDMNGARGGTTRNDIEVHYHVNSEEVARRANDDLMSKLKERGIGGAYL